MRCTIATRERGLIDIYPQSGTRISKISMEEVRESHFIREAMESAVRFVVQQGDSKLHKQLKSRLWQFKDSLDTAEKDLLFKFDELFHKTIAEFRFQNRLWKITNIAKSHMYRVRHLTLRSQKRFTKSLMNTNGLLNLSFDTNQTKL